MTESAYFSSEACKTCYDDIGLKKYEIIATLDSRTSDICNDQHGKIYELKEWEVGETAPPFHPLCRTTTAPVVEGWEEEVEYEKSDSYSKNAIVNNLIVNSSDFDKALGQLGESKKVTRVIKLQARKMLKHRNLTLKEDLVVINSDTAEFLISNLSTENQAVNPTKAMKKFFIENATKTIGIHNHPHSSLPSAPDIMVASTRKYKYGLVFCHDGTIYKYVSPYSLGSFDLFVYENQISLFLEEKISFDKMVEEIYNKTKIKLIKLL